MATTRLFEDGQIEELETLATEYKKLQRKRMATLSKEIDLKTQLLDAMKRNKKKHYKYDDIEIEIVPTGEKLKVKTIKEDDDEAEE